MQEQIKELYRPILFYIKKRVSDPMDAEDLTQEVFYKLSKSNYEEVENLKSWIYSIARNTIIDYYRKNKIKGQELVDLPDESSMNPSAISELTKCIVPFIDQLPPDYQHIMTLSELEGYSQKEIAKQLDINYITVRSKVQRGRKKLKTLFTNCCQIVQGGKGSIMDYRQNKSCDGDCE